MSSLDVENRFQDRRAQELCLPDLDRVRRRDG
jgi:hypothetical protein